MRILVTGGAGFIGSHVADASLAAGHEVGVVDDLSTGTRENLDPRAQFWQLDIRSDDLESVLATFRPDVINHHAAQISVSASARDPRRDADINILGTLNLLEAAVRHGVRRVIFASTGGAIYGDQDAVPTAETVFPQPVSPYGVAKLAVERYLHAYREMHGLLAIALRYSNVYGPRQSAQGEAGVVAIFSRAILEGRELTVNGDGAQTRDYVYIEDVVRANMLALECREPSAESRVDPQATHDDSQSRDPRIMSHQPSAIRNERRAGVPPLVLNIGTGRETSVNDLVRLFGEVAGKDVSCRLGSARPGEQRRSVLDSALAKRFLDWEATTDLRRGLAQTFQWFRSRYLAP
ncbi:MAG: NAD-dependent epimerase/dehydratase family protein [candidate division NC10 bacterium]|nr:NAD-dependent epimerase/dehydratase family protein [candidate division NC10 bacterium]